MNKQTITNQRAQAKLDLAAGEALWLAIPSHRKMEQGKRNGELAFIVFLMDDAVDAESLGKQHIIDDRLEQVRAMRAKLSAPLSL